MPSGRPQPDTEEDAQARVTLLAAREVAGSIESIRRRLKDTTLTPPTRARLREELLGAAERLVNLLELLDSRMDRLSKHLRPLLSEGIVELRNKLLSTGLRLVNDKVDRIHDRAVGVMTGGEEMSVGLSAALARSLAQVETTVEALGGKKVIPDDLGGKLDETERAVNNLQDMEGGHGMLEELEEGDDDEDGRS